MAERVAEAPELVGDVRLPKFFPNRGNLKRKCLHRLADFVDFRHGKSGTVNSSDKRPTTTKFDLFQRQRQDSSRVGNGLRAVFLLGFQLQSLMATATTKV